MIDEIYLDSFAVCRSDAPPGGSGDPAVHRYRFAEEIGNPLVCGGRTCDETGSFDRCEDAGRGKFSGAENRSDPRRWEVLRQTGQFSAQGRGREGVEIPDPFLLQGECPRKHLLCGGAAVSALFRHWETGRAHVEGDHRLAAGGAGICRRGRGRRAAGVPALHGGALSGGGCALPRTGFGGTAGPQL